MTMETTTWTTVTTRLRGNIWKYGIVLRNPVQNGKGNCLANVANVANVCRSPWTLQTSRLEKAKIVAVPEWQCRHFPKASAAQDNFHEHRAWMNKWFPSVHDRPKETWCVSSFFPYIFGSSEDCIKFEVIETGAIQLQQPSCLKRREPWNLNSEFWIQHSNTFDTHKQKSVDVNFPRNLTRKQ